MPYFEDLSVCLLTADYRDASDGHTIRFTGISQYHGPVELLFTQSRPVLFIKHEQELPQLTGLIERKIVNLRSLDGEDVDALYFDSQQELELAYALFEKKGIKSYESDINPCERFLMERFIKGQCVITGQGQKNGMLTRFFNPEIKPKAFAPKLKIASLDIETSIKSPHKLYSIAIHLTEFDLGKPFETSLMSSKNSGPESDGAITFQNEIKKVFMVGDKPDSKLHCFAKTEKKLLQDFLSWFNEINPDVIVGWMVIGFDLKFIQRKCEEHGLGFLLGRNRENAAVINTKKGRIYANVPGRIVVDVPSALKMAHYNFKSFSLENVSQALLGEGKIITPDMDKVHEIERLFEEDKFGLADYNLQDCVLVSKILKKTGLMHFLFNMMTESGLLWDDLGRSVLAFDHLFLPRLHRKGFVAPNINRGREREHLTGGLVIDPEAGRHANVVVVDFKSLYPSIIQTFKIDPYSKTMAHIAPLKTPVQTTFSQTETILPDIIQRLMNDRYKAVMRNDLHLAQSIKILMNSFYGVLGSTGCRFYDPEVSEAITGIGRWVLTESKRFFEKRGYDVVYGDTDSLFISVKESGKAIGDHLADQLTMWWTDKIADEYGISSSLQVRHEKTFSYLFLPPLRSGESGAKKRYVGLIEKEGKGRLHFVGMESVRSDWTPLAKLFQTELYKRFFNGERLESWIREFVSEVESGKHDTNLVYQKKLKKPPEEYVRSNPPHVRAARLIRKKSGTVRYIVTKQGPVPVELDPREPDYGHYIRRQIEPIANTVLSEFDNTFQRVVCNNLELFHQ